EWSNYTTSFRAVSGSRAVGTNLRLQFWVNSQGATVSKNLFLRNIKLEKGDVPTDWTPAPEDMLNQNDFSTFKAEYEQSAQGWSSKLLQIEQAGYATKTWSNQTFATPQSVTTQL